MIKFRVWLVLVILLICVVAQRGGGRGGGGRSSGGGRSFGRSFSSGRSFWSSRSGTRVHGSLPLWPTLGVIGGGALGVGGYYLYKRGARRREFFREQMENRNDEASIANMTETEFERERQKFLEGKWTFSYSQGAQRHNSQVTKITMKKEKPFLYHMDMTGSDSLGRWTAEGYFLGSPNGIKFWMLKDYVNKQEAGQTGAWEHLIYQGEQTVYKNYNGKWYYDGFVGSSLYSGQWEIILVQPLMSVPVPYR